VVTPNSYFAVTGNDGAFEIKDVPPGKYTLRLWHEELGEEFRKIEIGKNVTQVNFNFTELATPESQ